MENRQTDTTIICTTVNVRADIQTQSAKADEAAAEVKRADDKKRVDDEIRELLSYLKTTLGNRRFVMMENKKVWFDREVAGLYPKFDCVELPVFDTLNTNAAKYPGMVFEGFRFGTMTMSECRKTFSKGNGNPYIDAGGDVPLFSRECYRNGGLARFLTKEVNKGKSHVVRSDGVTGWGFSNNKITLVPICRLRGVDGAPMTFEESVVEWLKRGLMPEGLDDRHRQVYQRLLDVQADVAPYFSSPQQTFVAEIKPEPPVVKKSSPVDAARRELLECDYIRANLERYDEKRLTDLRRGHWELFEPKADGMTTVELPRGEYFVARPPHMDVRSDSVCAIDFGTKSTAVACLDQDARLIRIGIGEGGYSKAAALEDYENPTVIQLRDVEAFMEAYRARDGRPFTEWEQLTVSHAAADALNGIDDSLAYYSLFDELKQWANDKQRRLKFRDSKKQKLVELKPYCELGDGDFDPLEIYAYYLGLYINNMHRHICLDYIMSFPVTYDTEVRKRILRSFERGLKKSLPPALLSDESVMENFRVYAGASEPAAYAISALECFGLQPKTEDEQVSYAVFDFGGGTTDYDFGFERIPKNRRQHFVIERLGRGGGDAHLGGENILALMAYELYKDNIAEMRSKKIPFVLPPKGKPFAGSESLVLDINNASQEAQINTKRLSHLLRPIWEQHANYEGTFDKGAKRMVLLSSEGDKVNVDLRVNLEHMNECIERTIRAGVQDFFTEMVNAFDLRKSAPIHIFLAGNSCKSPVVRKLFEEAIEQYDQKTVAKIKSEGAPPEMPQGFFKLHLPLGVKPESEEPPAVEQKPPAAQSSEQREQLDLDRVRTGKTGVVFGLIRSRKGGHDVKIIDRDIKNQKEIVFPYYLGDIDRNNHFRVRIGRDVAYNQWGRFIAADEDEFELYYTKEARALENNLAPSDVKRVRCRLDEDDVDDELYVYIRKVSPDTIEYATGGDDDDMKGEIKGTVYKKTLR